MTMMICEQDRWCGLALIGLLGVLWAVVRRLERGRNKG
jgi:hypothetical protein